MRKLIILGNFSEGHVGAHLAKAAERKEGVIRLDSREMYGSGWMQKFFWHFFERKPLHIGRFSAQLQKLLDSEAPDSFLNVGLVPLPLEALVRLRERHVSTGIFLTDDPFNSAHRAVRVLKNIPQYDVVFTPRMSVVNDLRAAGARRVVYLPFAYDPDTHVSEKSTETVATGTDVMFVGGADPDRVPYIEALTKAGLSVALYGGFWDRYPSVAMNTRGIRKPSGLLDAARSTKIQVVLVRRANRDGHVMRTFEAAAARSCLIVEDTDDHRHLFGRDYDKVCYFKSPEDLVEKVTFLKDRSAMRNEMSRRVFEHIVRGGAHSYADRLHEIMLALTTNDLANL